MLKNDFSQENNIHNYTEVKYNINRILHTFHFIVVLVYLLFKEISFVVDKKCYCLEHLWHITTRH